MQCTHKKFTGQIEFYLKDAKDLSEKLTVFNLEKEIQNLTLKEQAFLMKKIKELETIAKEIKTTFTKLHDYLRINVLPERMDSEGYEGGLKIKDLGHVVLTPDVYASIPTGFKQQAYQWLSDNGHDLITETVNATSLKALAKRLLVENEPLPEEFFKVTPFTRASIRKTG